MSSENHRLLIVGAGNLGLYLRHLAEQLGHEVVGFVDNFKETTAQLTVWGDLTQLNSAFARSNATALAYAVGYHNLDTRIELFEAVLKSGLPIASLLHPSASIDPTSRIGTGSHVFAGCILDKGVTLGNNVLLNVGTCIAHDSAVGAHCFLSPRVSIAGFCEVGEGCLLGIGSVIVDNINIAANTTIGAGSLVTRSIEAGGGIYFGSPARWQRKRDEVEAIPYSGRSVKN